MGQSHRLKRQPGNTQLQVYPNNAHPVTSNRRISVSLQLFGLHKSSVVDSMQVNLSRAPKQKQTNKKKTLERLVPRQ